MFVLRERAVVIGTFPTLGDAMNAAVRRGCRTLPDLWVSTATQDLWSSGDGYTVAYQRDLA